MEKRFRRQPRKLAGFRRFDSVWRRADGWSTSSPFLACFFLSLSLLSFFLVVCLYFSYLGSFATTSLFARSLLSGCEPQGHTLNLWVIFHSVYSFSFPIHFRRLYIESLLVFCLISTFAFDFDDEAAMWATDSCTTLWYHTLSLLCFFWLCATKQGWPIK